MLHRQNSQRAAALETQRRYCKIASENISWWGPLTETPTQTVLQNIGCRSIASPGSSFGLHGIGDDNDVDLLLAKLIKSKVHHQNEVNFRNDVHGVCCLLSQGIIESFMAPTRNHRGGIVPGLWRWAKTLTVDLLLRARLLPRLSWRSFVWN